MKTKEAAELADLLRRAANLLSLPATPETWPEWMTYSRRAELAVRFRRTAEAIEKEKDNASNG